MRVKDGDAICSSVNFGTLDYSHSRSLKVCGLFLLFALLVGAANQANAQSTDTCENVGGQWYKSCLDCTHQTHPGTGVHLAGPRCHVGSMVLVRSW